MKKTIIYISLIGVLAFTSSCKGFLDQESETAVSTDQAVTSYDDALTALNGVYDALQGSSAWTTYYARDFISYGSVRGDLMQGSNLDNRAASLYEMSYSGDNAPTTAWQTAYRTIRRTNNLIADVDAGKAVGGTPEQVANIKAQCQVLRALCHFDLVRVYSLPYVKSGSPVSYGIPVVTSSLAPSETPGRGTVEDVYTQVIKDLTDALPALGKGTKLGFVNYWVAQGLLSRVYLTKGDYPKALSAAQAVIGDGTTAVANMPYKLWTAAEYPVSWNVPGSSELMFEIVNNGTDDWGDRESIGYLYSEVGYASVVATPKLVNYFKANANDVRGKLLYAPTKHNSAMKIFGDLKVFCNKFPGRLGDPRINNIPALRLSEVYMNAAEAALQTGNATLAGTYLNTIYGRANAGATPLEATLENIQLQRGIELFGEGHRAFDMLRWGLNVDRTASNRYNYSTLRVETVNWDTFQAFLPIPLSERNANSTIRTQKNAGY